MHLTSSRHSDTVSFYQVSSVQLVTEKNFDFVSYCAIFENLFLNAYWANEHIVVQKRDLL